MRGALAVIVFLCASAALAQLGEKITVNIVEVPVTVAGRDGHAIRGLVAADFTLLDDGKPQAITGFDAIDFASSENVTAITPLNPSARRSFMLLFDFGFSSPASLARAQEAARRFVAQSVKPRDLVAVGSIEPDRGFRLLTAFTTDRDLLAAAIKDPGSFRGNDPLQLANVTRTFEPAPARRDDEQREVAARASQQNEAYVRGRIEKEIESLGNLAATLRAVPGRKQIVLLSEGFDPRYVRGGDVPPARRRTYPNVDADVRFGSTGTLKTLDEMAKLFRASDVVLHAVDIQGVRPLNTNDALYLLTEPTGGEVFASSNDLAVHFDNLLRRQEVVYVLSFRGANARPGRVHTLSVSVKNIAGARVSHRAAYVESPGETTTSRLLTNADVIMNDVAQTDIRVAAMASAFPVDGDAAQVPVIVEMNGADLLRGVKNSVIAAEIFLYAFDEEGLVRDRLYQRMTLDTAKVGERLRNGGIKFYATLALPPGRYAIKSLVKLADSDRRGFARSDLVVPRRDEVAVMPFFIDEHPSNWLLVRGSSHEQVAQYPFVINGETLVPSAARAGKLAVVVFNAKPYEIAIETTPKANIVTRAAAGSSTQIVLDVAPGAMEVAVSKGATVRKLTLE
jgi:VWFA-related protein